jgi:hypothetical protein
MTPQTEALFQFIQQTIDTELVEKLAFLANYDETKKAIQEVVDMPDRKIDLFIQSCQQNKGRLSSRKRTCHFDFLSDEEVTSMEEAIRKLYMEYQKTGVIEVAAMKAGMNRKTAGGYIKSGEMPTDRRTELTWRTNYRGVNEEWNRR